MTNFEPTAAGMATPEEITSFRENGFVAITRCLTSADELETMRQAYDSVFSSHAGAEEGNHFDLGGPSTEESLGPDSDEPRLPQILGPDRYNPNLRGPLLVANCRALARSLMGEGANFGESGHAILKPPSGPETPWHQDEAYWAPDQEYHSCSIWVPLQDVDAASGCLHFVPGSHRMEVLPHRHIGGDPLVHGLELDVPYDFSDAVACPLPAGGATFHYNRTLHFSGPNATGMPRRAYVLSAGFPTTARAVPEPRPWQEVEDASGYAAQLRHRASQTPPMGKGFRVENDVSDAAVTQNRVARTEAPRSAVGVGAARL